MDTWSLQQGWGAGVCVGGGEGGGLIVVGRPRCARRLSVAGVGVPRGGVRGVWVRGDAVYQHII